MSVTETNNVNTAVDAQPAGPAAADPGEDAAVKETQAPDPDSDRVRLPTIFLD